MELKLGKKPFVIDHRDFLLAPLTVVPLPPTPVNNFGYGTTFLDWQMLGNNQAGNCVWAGADHETMLFEYLAQPSGKKNKAAILTQFSDATALQDYSDATGYNIETGANDDGTEVRSAMSYRRNTGLIDNQGSRHKIDAYVKVSPGDWELMLRCIWTFGAVGMGFDVPESCIEQFHNHEAWTYVGDENIIGGHYVCGIGSTNPTKRVTVVTWGRRQFMDKEFYRHYNDELWIPLSRESMKASGFNVRHIDWIALTDMLSAL